MGTMGRLSLAAAALGLAWTAVSAAPPAADKSFISEAMAFAPEGDSAPEPPPCSGRNPGEPGNNYCARTGCNVKKCGQDGRTGIVIGKDPRQPMVSSTEC